MQRCVLHLGPWQAGSLQRTWPSCEKVPRCQNAARSFFPNGVSPPLLRRDDPEAVDLASLYAEQEAAVNEEGEGPFDVDLDDEYDLMHDRDPGLGGTLAGNVDPLTGDKAGPEDVGQYSGEA